MLTFITNPAAISKRHSFYNNQSKNEMAQCFHVKNGAVVFRENADTVNYKYKVIDTDSKP